MEVIAAVQSLCEEEFMMPLRYPVTSRYYGNGQHADSPATTLQTIRQHPGEVIPSHGVVFVVLGL